MNPTVARAATLVVSVVLIIAVAHALALVAVRRAIRGRCVPPALGRPTSALAAAVDRFGVWWEQRQAARRSDAAAVADLLDDTARRCASGHSLTTAFLAAHAGWRDAMTIDPLAAAVTALHSGNSLDASLDRVDAGDPDVMLAVHLLRLCCSQGGSITESLDRAAATLRERQTVYDERIASAAQARLSAQVLTVLPIGFAAWTVLTTESVQRFVASPAGIVCISLGLSLNAIGWVLMRRAIEVRR